jgi:general secretion pathway protein D
MVSVLAGCAEQWAHDRSSDALRRGDFEHAVAESDAAVRAYPDNTQLRADAVTVRTEAVARLVAQAQAARREHRYADARAALERAAHLDVNPTRTAALLAELDVEVRLVQARMAAEALIARQDWVGASALIADALKDDPRQPELLALQRRVEYLDRERKPRGPVALSETRPISLDFRDASLRTVLDAVTRSSGVNFILDKDLRADGRVTVFLHDAKVEDALDLITSTNQLGRWIVDGKTVLIYPNTPEKQRDYQQQVVRVFYLANAEAKTGAAFLKSMLKVHEPFVDDRSNMIALRDTPENVQIAERLLTLFDTADPEVQLDLEVLEISSTRLTELGVQFPNSVVLTPLAPTNATGLTLGNVLGLTRDNVGVGVGSLLINLRREVGDARTLARPSIRVRSKEKAKVLIGDKVPVITTTTGQVGFVSDSVNYLDVGLKLEAEPTVYADGEVVIKIGLEVSAVNGQVKTASGTLAYQIGTRNAATVLRLRDGESQLLAGLISQDDRSSANRVPGLGDLPIAGRLFSSQLDNGQRTELVLAITPHVVRNLRRPEASEAELWVGTETAPRLHRIQSSPAPAAEGQAIAPKRDGAEARGAANALGSDAGKPAEAIPRDESPAAGMPAARLRLSAPSNVAKGQVFTVNVDLESTAALRGLPIQIRYSNDRLTLLAIEHGGYFSRDGVATSFTQSVQPGDGTARAGVLRNSATSATGSGTVYRLQFRAEKAGSAEIAVTNANPLTLSGDVRTTLPDVLTLPIP